MVREGFTSQLAPQIREIFWLLAFVLFALCAIVVIFAGDLILAFERDRRRQQSRRATVRYQCRRNRGRPSATEVTVVGLNTIEEGPAVDDRLI